MPAIDQPAAKAALCFAELVEMNLGGVLIETRRQHMLGLFDGHTIDMIDALAFPIVIETVTRARKRIIPHFAGDFGTASAEIGGQHSLGQVGGLRSGS